MVVVVVVVVVASTASGRGTETSGSPHRQRSPLKTKAIGLQAAASCREEGEVPAGHALCRRPPQPGLVQRSALESRRQRGLARTAEGEVLCSAWLFVCAGAYPPNGQRSHRTSRGESDGLPKARARGAKEHGSTLERPDPLPSAVRRVLIHRGVSNGSFLTLPRSINNGCTAILPAPARRHACVWWQAACANAAPRPRNHPCQRA